MPPVNDQTDEEKIAEIAAQASAEPDDGSTVDPLDLLTEEEIAALDDDDFIDDGVDDPEVPEADPVIAAEAEPVEPASDPEPEAEPIAAATPEPEPVQRVEIPVATITKEMVDGKTAELKTKGEDAFKKYEDGEFSSEEYREALNAISDEQNEFRDAFATEQAKITLAADNETRAWDSASKQFMAANPELGSEKHMRGFDKIVRYVTSQAQAGTSFSNMLEDAKAMYETTAARAGNPLSKPKADLAPTPEPEKAPEAKAVKPTLPLPGQTLSNIPAAAVSPAADGKYAALDDLMAKGSPDEIEAVLGRMSTEEAERYASAL